MVTTGLSLIMLFYLYPKTKQPLILFLTVVILFAGLNCIFYFLLKDYVFPKLLKESIKVYQFTFQLASDIEIKNVKNSFVAEFYMNSVGKQLKLIVSAPRKIINPREFILGSVNIKEYRNYKISFLVKQYQYQNESFIHELQPIAIDHESLDQYLVDYRLKESFKIRPKIFLIKNG